MSSFREKIKLTAISERQKLNEQVAADGQKIPDIHKLYL